MIQEIHDSIYIFGAILGSYLLFCLKHDDERVEAEYNIKCLDMNFMLTPSWIIFFFLMDQIKVYV